MHFDTIFMHRLLQSIFLPPLNGILIVLIGILILKRRSLIAKIFMLLGLSIIYIQATPYFAEYLTKKIEPQPFNENYIESIQAMVVLGGGVNNNSMEYDVNAMASAATLSRLRYAAYLAKKYPGKLIITTGGALSDGDSEADLMRRALIEEFGIINNIILTEDKSVSTNQNAEYVASMLHKYNINNVLIITQAYHARRAVALFAKYGITAYAGATGYYNTGYYIRPVLWFVPSASAMLQTSNIVREIVGYFYDVY